jgi:hypothetical protein
VAYTLGCGVCRAPFDTELEKWRALRPGDGCPLRDCAGFVATLDPEIGRALDAHRADLLAGGSDFFLGRRA